MIHNPYNFKNILREIVHIVVCEILRTEEIDEYQILTPVLPESFPVDNLIVLKGLSTFRGILIEIGDSEKYTWVFKGFGSYRNISKFCCLRLRNVIENPLIIEIKNCFLFDDISKCLEGFYKYFIIFKNLIIIITSK